ncbi:MAG: glycosyltransferase family 2 protein [archaeon]
MRKRKLAPIVLFVYSRLDHTKITVEALKQNFLAKESQLFVFSDGPKTPEKAGEVNKVRNYLRSIKGFKSVKIFENKKNKGLAKSIIGGVTKIVNQYGRVIVVEDDLLTSKYFLTFMNDALDFYENEKQVISISGYVYPAKDLPKTFFIRGADCWGWATWKRGWKMFETNGSKLLKQLQEKGLTKEFNFDDSYDYIQMLRDQIEGKNSSWAIRWYASAFLAGKLTLYPGKSFVRNIGVDGSGTHGGLVDVYYTELFESKLPFELIPIVEDTVVRKKFSRFFKKMHSKLFRLSIFVKNYFVHLFHF